MSAPLRAWHRSEGEHSKARFGPTLSAELPGAEPLPEPIAVRKPRLRRGSARDEVEVRVVTAAIALLQRDGAGDAQARVPDDQGP